MFGNANNTSVTEQQQPSVPSLASRPVSASLFWDTTRSSQGHCAAMKVCPHRGLSRSRDPAANPRRYGRKASSAMTCWFPLFWLWLTKSPLTHRESISPLPLSSHSRALLLAFIWNPPPLVSFHLPRAEIQSLSNRPYLWNILLVLDDRKKRALWLLWASLRLLAARRDQMRLSRGNIQLLMTLTHLFRRLFSCLREIFYTQNCRCTNHEGIYLVITVCIRMRSYTCCS